MSPDSSRVAHRYLLAYRPYLSRPRFSPPSTPGDWDENRETRDKPYPGQTREEFYEQEGPLPPRKAPFPTFQGDILEYKKWENGEDTIALIGGPPTLMEEILHKLKAEGFKPVPGKHDPLIWEKVSYLVPAGTMNVLRDMIFKINKKAQSSRVASRYLKV